MTLIRGPGRALLFDARRFDLSRRDKFVRHRALDSEAVFKVSEPAKLGLLSVS
jgi:hypothetical protein